MNKLNTKYEFAASKKINGVQMNQIRALKSFGNVKKGDLGGWIQAENNLDWDDNCWVYGSGLVYGGGSVADNAKVEQFAEVFGSASVGGQAVISGEAEVFENSKVWGNCQIYGSAVVKGKAEIDGHCAVYGRAIISGTSYVTDDAEVYGTAVLTGANGGGVSGRAQVFGDAGVTQAATVMDNAKVFGNALISKNASVRENAMVSGKAHITDDAVVKGKAKVYGSSVISGQAVIAGKAILQTQKVSGWEIIQEENNMQNDKRTTLLETNIGSDSLNDIAQRILLGESVAPHPDLVAIETAVKDYKVGDKTNFGVVTAIGQDSITFKAKDLPVSKIKFRERKIGSKDFILSKLTKM